jgi:hypothetical protein
VANGRARHAIREVHQRQLLLGICFNYKCLHVICFLMCNIR